MATFPYKESKNATYDSNVAAVQRDLNALRPKAEEKFQMSVWGDLSTDGCYGPKTAAVVKTFQSLYGLSSDGVFGPATQSALRSALRDEKVKANSKPVSASINSNMCSSSVDANYTPSCDNNLITESAPTPEIPTCAQNFSPVVPASQQDDFMCSPLTTTEPVVSKPSGAKASHLTDADKMIDEIKTALCAFLDGVANVGNDPEYNGSSLSSLKTPYQRFSGLIIPTIRKNKTTILSGSQTVTPASRAWNSSQITNYTNYYLKQNPKPSQKLAPEQVSEVIKEQSKKLVKESPNIAKKAAAEAEKQLANAAKSAVLGPKMAIFKSSSIISTVLNFWVPIKMLFEPDKDENWKNRFETQFIKAVEQCVVSFIAGCISKCMTRSLGAAFLIGLAISYIFSFIYSLITGEDKTLMEAYLEVSNESLLYNYKKYGENLPPGRVKIMYRRY